MFPEREDWRDTKYFHAQTFLFQARLRMEEIGLEVETQGYLHITRILRTRQLPEDG